ncbi:MAG: class I SAM-dependent methyltransferase [bacterium]|nr:class I SAM-dependent methyltransferase [bacterium]
MHNTDYKKLSSENSELIKKDKFIHSYMTMFQTVHFQYINDLCNSTCIIDKEGLKIGRQYVMFFNEKELMYKHASLLLQDNDSKDLLEIGYGLGIFSQAACSIGVKSQTIIEIHPWLVERAKIWRDSLKEPNKVFIINNAWQKSLESLGKYDAIMYDACSPSGYSHYDFEYLIEILCSEKLKAGGLLSFWNSGVRIPPIKEHILKNNFKTIHKYKYKMISIPKHWVQKTNCFIIPIAVK